MMTFSYTIFTGKYLLQMFIYTKIHNCLGSLNFFFPKLQDSINKEIFISNFFNCFGGKNILTRNFIMLRNKINILLIKNKKI